MGGLSSLGRKLIKPLDQLARSERVGNVVRVGAGTAVQAIPGFAIARSIANREGWKGAARGAIAFVPGGQLASAAYGLKRGRDKAQAREGKFRRAIRDTDDQIRDYSARIKRLRVATNPLDSGAGSLGGIQVPELGLVITPLQMQTVPGAVSNGAQDEPGGLQPLDQDRAGAPVASSPEETAAAPVLAGPGSKLTGFLVLGAVAWWLLRRSNG